ncbi:FabD/lysophospholipase-like protein [Cenococcum geophilum]
MPKYSLCLLTLNRGGQLIKTINPDVSPKLYNYFNIIRGTSTGGSLTSVIGFARLRLISLAKDALLKDAPDIKYKVKETGDTEGLIDGAIGANNLVYKLSGSLKDKVKCLVLIRIGVPLLTPFKDNLDNIRKSLLAITIDRKILALNNTGRYYQFNVLRGLKDIRLKNIK